jgi:hypothetical protein
VCQTTRQIRGLVKLMALGISPVAAVAAAALAYVLVRRLAVPAALVGFFGVCAYVLLVIVRWY